MVKEDQMVAVTREMEDRRRFCLSGGKVHDAKICSCVEECEPQDTFDGAVADQYVQAGDASFCTGCTASTKGVKETENARAKKEPKRVEPALEDGE